MSGRLRRPQAAGPATAQQAHAERRTVRASSGGFQALESAAQRAAVAKSLRAQQIGGGGAAFAGGADQQIAPVEVELAASVSSLDMGRCRRPAGSGSASRSRAVAHVDEREAGARARRRARRTALRVPSGAGDGRGAGAPPRDAPRIPAARRARRRCVLKVTRSKISISSGRGRAGPASSLSASSACRLPNTPGTGPSTPASAQLPTRPSRVASGHTQRRQARGIVAAHQLQLPFVLVDAREQHRLAGAQREVVEQELGGEVVAAVEDEVVAGARAVRRCRRRGAAHALRRALRD